MDKIKQRDVNRVEKKRNIQTKITFQQREAEEKNRSFIFGVLCIGCLQET